MKKPGEMSSNRSYATFAEWWRMWQYPHAGSASHKAAWDAAIDSQQAKWDALQEALGHQLAEKDAEIARLRAKGNGK